MQEAGSRVVKAASERGPAVCSLFQRAQMLKNGSTVTYPHVRKILVLQQNKSIMPLSESVSVLFLYAASGKKPGGRNRNDLYLMFIFIL